MNYLTILFILLNLSSILSGSIELTESNFDSIVYANQLVFVNFYVNSCRFSQNLNKIYEDLSEQITKQYSENYKNKENLIQIAKVNCELTVSICKKYEISKYPTLKLFRNGLVNKREYRKSRDLNSLIEYLKSEIESPIKEFNNSNIDIKYDYLIGHFTNSNSKSFQIFSKIANLLRDQCRFAVSFNNDSKEFVYYQSNELLNRKEFYSDSLENEQMFYFWSNKKCEKLIEEIRFDNAEELIDQGLPFLILFHRINDQNSIELFEQQIQKELIHFQSKINFLHADGSKFVHPLKHLGKTIDDLPLIVIDTFQHMFIFKDFHQLSIKGKLLRFVEDLFSGKVHENLNESLVESVFIRLSPSRQRYSFRDEL